MIAPIGPAVYIPGGDCQSIIEALPENLVRYRDHAAWFISEIQKPIWRHRDKADPFTRLNNRILRQYVPQRPLTEIQTHLTDSGVIQTANHSQGRRARGYAMKESYKGVPARHVIRDPKLSRKIRDKQIVAYTDRIDAGTRSIVEQRRPILDAMRRSLVELQLSESVSEIERRLSGTVDSSHLRYAASTIAHGDHGPVYVDPFGRRVHSTITYTTAELRPFFRFGKAELALLDVRNSQPLVLAAFLKNAPHIKDLHHLLGEGAGIPPGVPALDTDSCFTELCETGLIYDKLAEDTGLTRAEVKHKMFVEVLFGRPRQRGRVSEAFSNRWPDVNTWIVEMKQANGYKVIAQILQRTESTIIIDGVCRRISEEMDGLPYLTIHDAILCPVKYAGAVEQIMLAEFERYGVAATIKTTELKATS